MQTVQDFDHEFVSNEDSYNKRNEQHPNLPGQIHSTQESNHSDSFTEKNREKAIDFRTEKTEPLKAFYSRSSFQSSSSDLGSNLGAKQTSTTRQSDDDFDLQKFRSLGPKQLQEILQSQTSKNNFEITRAKPGQIYKYLGQSYILEFLQERNKDPRVLLNLNLSMLVIGDSSALYLFIVGTNYNIVPTILIIISVLLSIIAGPLNFNTSLKNGIQFKTLGILLLGLCMNFWSVALIYCFIYRPPFNSIPIYLLYLEALSFFACIIISTELLPCKIPWNDEQYQIKYFMSLIMLAVFNATGLIDVLSDIVFGVELILHFKGILPILGFSLFLLCLMDLFIVSIRMIMPQKVSVKMHVVAFLLEVVILGVSIGAVFIVQSQKKSTEDHLKMLMMISLVTTGINFMHHLFIISDSIVATRNNRSPRNLATMFS